MEVILPVVFIIIIIIEFQDYNRSGRNTEEYKAVIAHFADISSAIQDPTCLAGHLLQAQLIYIDVHNDVCNPSLKHNDRVSTIMRCVLIQIEQSVSNFYAFTEVLEKNPLLSGLSKQMKFKAKCPEGKITVMIE